MDTFKIMQFPVFIYMLNIIPVQKPKEKPDTAAYISNLSTWEVKAKKINQKVPRLHSNIKASLGYMTPWLKIKQKRISEEVLFVYTAKLALINRVT